MPNITTVVNDQIRRISRREITKNMASLRRVSAQQRRDVAALKRQVAAMEKAIAFLEQQEKRRVSSAPPPQKAGGVRFRAAGLKSHRSRLSLSAKDYGRLAGVSALTIYNWERGKTRPRPQQLGKLAAIRGLGKREAEKRLELLGGR